MDENLQNIKMDTIVLENLFMRHNLLIAYFLLSPSYKELRIGWGHFQECIEVTHFLKDFMLRKELEHSF